MTRRLLSALKIVLCVAFVPFAHAGNYLSFVDQLSSNAPQLNRQVLSSALQAAQCAVSSGIEAPKRLAVIDFSLSSDKKRLWVFDLEEGSLVLNDLVAHGKNTGNETAQNFSNVVGSLQSSIGLFQANETYSGKHGYSLRLDGLEPGVNDRARERAIVIHGADYVNPEWIETQGRIGRSYGCPAVRQEIVREVVDNLKGGQLLFTYYPDQKWLHTSNYLHCHRNTASISGAEAGEENS